MSNLLTRDGLSAIKLCTNIQGFQRMNSDDPLSFPLASSSDQNFNLLQRYVMIFQFKSKPYFQNYISAMKRYILLGIL